MTVVIIAAGYVNNVYTRAVAADIALLVGFTIRGKRSRFSCSSSSSFSSISRVV